MKSAILGSWKTTSGGVGAAVVLLLVAYFTNGHHIPPEILAIAGGLAGLGATAKDHDVTGGTKEQ